MEEDELHSPLLHQDCNIDNNTSQEPAPHYDQSGLQTFDWLGRAAAFHSGTLGGKRTLFFTTATACLWHLALFGVFFNMVLFFKNVLNEGSGVAARDTNNWVGTLFLSSLLGAFIAESYVGRLWTYVAFQTVAMAGFLLLMVATNMVLSAETTTGATRAFVHWSMYLVSISYGASVPALQALGADQFDVEEDKVLFFTYHVMGSNVGMALADTVVVYAIAAKGWLVGFALAAMFGAGGWVLFVVGIPWYRQYRNRGNPYKRALQVVVAAARKWRVPLPACSDALYQDWGGLYMDLNKDQGKPQQPLQHTKNLRWLDKAAAVRALDVQNGDGTRNRWKLSSVTEVEEVKAVVRLIPLWATIIFFHTIHAQAGTLLVEEGALMDTNINFLRGGSHTLEPATMNLFNILVVVLVAPLYKVAMVPVARRITGLPGGLTPLQQTGIGYVVSVAAVLLVGMLEAYRLHCYKSGLSAPSILWQVPEFSLLGFAQFFGGVGQLGFFYANIPLSLRSLGCCFLMTGTALGSYVSSMLVWLVNSWGGWLPQDLNDGHLHYFFWLLGGLGSLSFLCFLTCAASFTRHKFLQ